MHDCLISFGSNLGRSESVFDSVVEHFRQLREVESIQASSLLSTRPVGGPREQNDYLNGCLRVSTNLGVPELFELNRSLEKKLGRVRRERWGSRAIDLDLLLFDDQTTFIPNLQVLVPHPRMSFRRFVLVPAKQVAAKMVHPTSGLTIAQLLSHLDERPDRIAMLASSTEIHEKLAAKSNRLCDARGWMFSWHSTLDLVHEYSELTKLLIFFDDDSEYTDVASRFPGPTLRLNHADWSSVTTEINAAIQAMTSL